MKKILLLISTLLVSGMIVNSCVEPLVPNSARTQVSATGLDLSVLCTAPFTKADTEEEETYNENALLHVDWFVFTSNASSAKAVLHARESWTNKGNVTEAFIARTIDMEPYITSFNTKSGYVYVIANLPDNYSHVIDETADNTYTGGIQYTVGNETVTVNTLGELQVLPLTADFNKYHQTDATDYTTAVFDPQDAFVMQSAVLPFTMTDQNPVAKAEAKLTRVAAKITVDLDVITAIDEVEAEMIGRDTISVNYLQTWYPNLDKVEMYLSFANSVTTLKGTPTAYNNTDFFTYNRYAFQRQYTEGTDSNPHSYPSTDVFHKVWGTPFYTYPMKWIMNDPHAPFIKIIIPWTAYEESASMQDHNYVTHNATAAPFTHVGDTLKSVTRSKETIAEDGTKEFFYKITIPVEDLQLLSNNWYKIKLDVAILGSRSDDLSTELSGQYYVVNWSEPEEVGGGKLKQGQYLSLASSRSTYYIYGGNSIEIPVKSSHNLVTGTNATRITRAQRWNPSTQQLVDIDRGSVDVNGRTSLTFTNNLNTTISNQLDCYRMEFDVTIVNEVGLQEKITIIQYPSIYIDSKPGGNVMVDGYYGNVDNHYHATGNGATPYGNSGTNTSTTTQTPYAPISNYVDQQQAMTVISISALNNATYTIPGNAQGAGTYTYVIADPRQASGYEGNDLTSHYSGEYNNTNAGTRLVPWTDDEASKIKVGSMTGNFIAPRFMVSSRWGRMGNWTPPGNADERFETVQKRCATYQEAGYPAGRWRLPTEAEIMFIANLQKYSLISNLFTTSGPSISASGSVFTVPEGGSTAQIQYAAAGLNNNGGRSCRCVYDLWYWGDDPVEGATSTYTIMP